MSNDPHGQTNQPLPVANDNPSSHDLLVADIIARKEFGFKKYGSLLQANNGRDTLRDAYEEAQDLCVYLRTLIDERVDVAMVARMECAACIADLQYIQEAYKPGSAMYTAVATCIEALRMRVDKQHGGYTVHGTSEWGGHVP